MTGHTTEVKTQRLCMRENAGSVWNLPGPPHIWLQEALEAKGLDYALKVQGVQ